MGKKKCPEWDHNEFGGVLHPLFGTGCEALRTGNLKFVDNLKKFEYLNFKVLKPINSDRDDALDRVRFWYPLCSPYVTWSAVTDHIYPWLEPTVHPSTYSHHHIHSKQWAVSCLLLLVLRHPKPPSFNAVTNFFAALAGLPFSCALVWSIDWPTFLLCALWSSDWPAIFMCALWSTNWFALGMPLRAFLER
eukprot:1156847-Pelagomonas_calceolata.AAC.7